MELVDHHLVLPYFAFVDAHVLLAMSLLESVLLTHPVFVDVQDRVDDRLDVTTSEDGLLATDWTHQLEDVLDVLTFVELCFSVIFDAFLEHVNLS